MLLAILIFVAAFAVIVTEKVHRTKVALSAAALMVILGVIEQDHAIEAIDFNTIGLLAGMMIIVRQTEKSGLYDYIAIRAGQRSGGHPFALIAYLAGITAILSPFLDNLTTILLVVPITFLLADALDISPYPLLFAEVMASNISGTATLIGDPPNILIAGATGLSFMDFIVNLAPIAALTLLVVVPGIYFVYRKDLAAAEVRRARLMALNASASITDAKMLRRQAPVLVLTILAFFVHKAVGLEPATIALTGATIMLLLSTQSVEESLEEIEWSTLFFFLGLFVVVGGLEEQGVLRDLAKGFTNLTEDSFPATLLGIAWLSALASGIVDNIPFTAAMIPVIDDIQEITGREADAHWWALAMGTGFGGNLTLVAAAANVAAAGLAERAGYPISFLQFFKVGALAVLASMLLATGYIAIRYF